MSANNPQNFFDFSLLRVFCGPLKSPGGQRFLREGRTLFRAVQSLSLASGRNDFTMTIKFKPLHDRVLVRRVEGEERTAGGIIIPDTAKEKPMEGEIIAAGSGNRDEAGKLVPLDVKKGDRVLFAKWSGTEVKINGEELLIIKESDILGIIENEKSEKKATKKAA